MSEDGFQEIRPGTIVLGRFEIRERVARGGFAVVWRAHDRLLGKDVALKVLQTSIAEDPAAVEELKRETLRSRELTHPHIVQTYDFVQDGSVVALAMEFVDGATMATLAAQRPNGCFNPRDVAAWLADVCDALDYAHSEKGGKRSVIHHDLKPSNFMVDRFGTAKVLDFGIAKGVAETRYQHTGQFAVAGTPPYMSPQQLLGQRPRPSDDIYSMGATIYALLTGKPPFYRGDLAMQIGNEIAPTMNRRRAELEIDEPPIPQEWEETVVACLAKDPEHRPKAMNEVAVRLGVREPSTRRVAPATVRDAGTARPKTDRPKTARRAGTVAASPRRTWLTISTSLLLATGILLWPAGGGESWREPASFDEPHVADVAPVTKPRTQPILADVGGLPSFGVLADTPLNGLVARQLDNQERVSRERAERVASLREDVARAIRASAWDDAAQLLPELAALAPDDADVAASLRTVEDQRGIRDLLDRYRAAQEALDADAYKRLWVGLDEQKLTALRRSYADLQFLSLSIQDVQTRVGATTATVRFHESIAFALNGLERQATEANTTLTLQRTSAGWRIAARSSEQ